MYHLQEGILIGRNSKDMKKWGRNFSHTKRRNKGIEKFNRLTCCMDLDVKKNSSYPIIYYRIF